MTPLILVPGHLCGPWLYELQMPALTGTVTLADVTLDDTIGAMAERLLATAPKRFAIAGLSMGGMVAMEVMARAPDRVVGACLMDTDPMPAREKEIAWRNELLSQGLEIYIATFVSRFYAHDQWVADRLGAQTLNLMSQTPEPVARAQARALDTRREMIPLIEGYDGPVEILVGADDRVCPPMLHAPLVSALPKAVMVKIDPCGHIATLEQPAAVTERMVEWLERCESAPA